MSAGAAPAGGFVLSARLPVDGDAAMSIRVLVADDQSMVRAGFRMLLSGEPGHRGRRRGEQRARGGRQGRALPADRRADGHPHARARRARGDPADPRRRRHGARILILTTFDLDEYVYEALRAGASGFVLKDDPPEQLLAAIRTVADGDALLSPAITKRVIEQFTRTPRPTPPASSTS